MPKQCTAVMRGTIARCRLNAGHDGYHDPFAHREEDDTAPQPAPAVPTGEPPVNSCATVPCNCAVTHFFTREGWCAVCGGSAPPTGPATAETTISAEDMDYLRGVLRDRPAAAPQFGMGAYPSLDRAWDIVEATLAALTAERAARASAEAMIHPDRVEWLRGQAKRMRREDGRMLDLACGLAATADYLEGLHRALAGGGQ